MISMKGLTMKNNANNKKKRGLFRIVFGRTTIVVLLILMQVAMLFCAYAFLANKIIYYQGVITAISFVTLVCIINNDENAGFKIAWIIPVLAFPVFGALFYLYCRNQYSIKMIKGKLNSIDADIKQYQRKSIGADSVEVNNDLGEVGIANYLYNSGNYSAYTESGIEYYPLGDDMYVSLVRELEKAEKFIFLEYFIIAKGYMWDSILDILKRKVSEGVEVRLMYDGMCSFVLLPYSYPKQLEEYGIKCRMFAPIVPVLSTYHNNRDHRKIVVIDGRTAFTGGVNLADEYINHIERFGHWKDTGVMIKGDAVKSMTLMFLQLWNVSEQHMERHYSKYLIDNPEIKGNQGIVIPFGDGPYNREDIGKNVYIDILNRAHRYVHIMTPYLILDDEMVAALRYSAERDVETIIIMPHIPDKKYAYLLARTYYKELIEYGVKIYEYTPGFVHAKQFVSDDIRGVVGSFNLDYRSMYLHYECAVYMYNTPVISDIEKDFQDTLAKCQQITVKTCNEYSKIGMLIGRVLRIFAPLM